jgi:pyruvate formate lyase activating enzyme
MNIIGHQKTSFIDYPDKICTVYFTAGCNFRCPYCHNSHIVKGQGKSIEKEEIFNFLEKRKKFIDAVCISGGEPTLYEELPEFAREIKERGFLLKLDTNGTNPQMLESLIKKKYLNYVAMDLKAPWNKYELVSGAKLNIELLKASVQIIKSSNIDYEFRTTVCQELLSPEDILEIAETLKGSKRYCLQNFHDTETILAGAGKFHAYHADVLEEIGNQIKNMFDIFKIR